MREEHVPLSAGVAALEQELRRLELCEEICPMAPMAPRTTLRIGGAADLLVTPRSASAVAEIVALAREGGIPFLILGNGSNLLVSDLGVEGLVISLRETLCKTRREGNRLTAGAGLLLSAAAAFARDEGLSGLEFAAGIPGTVGGGVYMNCGAYGSEMKDVVESSLVLGSDGEISILKARQHGFSYRHSSLMENGERKASVVLAAMRELIEGEPLARIDYVEMVDAVSMQPVEEAQGSVLCAMAVYVGKTRLIDNFIFEG